MNVESALFAFLSANAGIQAAVGKRIYPAALPKSPTFPAIVYQRQPAAPPDRLQDGEIIFTHARFHIIPLGQGERAYAMAKEARDAVFAALDNYSGQFADLYAHDITVEEEADDVELPPELTDQKIVGVRMTIDITL